MLRPSWLSLATLFGAWSSLAVASAVLARPPIVPEAMVEACRSLAEGAPCAFDMSDKHVTGVCAPLPDKELACRPGGPGAKRARAQSKPAPSPAP